MKTNKVKQEANISDLINRAAINSNDLTFAERNIVNIFHKRERTKANADAIAEKRASKAKK